MSLIVIIVNYSRNNLSKIKDETYIINIDQYESIGTHWSALYAIVIEYKQHK